MDYYTTENFPRLVWDRQNDPWRIYANAEGKCAAIPRDLSSGHLASAYGTIGYVVKQKQDAIRRFERACMDQSAKWLSACIADAPATWTKAHYAIARRALRSTLA